MIQFLKTPSTHNQSGPTVKVSIEEDESFDRILDAFKGFLQACTFPIDSDEILSLSVPHSDKEIDETEDSFFDDDEAELNNLENNECCGTCGCYKKEDDTPADVDIDVSIDLSDDTFAALCEMAHEQDITFNKLCNNILEEYIMGVEAQKEFNSVVDMLPK